MENVYAGNQGSSRTGARGVFSMHELGLLGFALRRIRCCNGIARQGGGFRHRLQLGDSDSHYCHPGLHVGYRNRFGDSQWSVGDQPEKLAVSYPFRDLYWSLLVVLLSGVATRACLKRGSCRQAQCCTCHPGCVAVPGRASNSIEDRRCVTDYYWRGDFGFRLVVMLYEHLGKF